MGKSQEKTTEPSATVFLIERLEKKVSSNLLNLFFKYCTHPDVWVGKQKQKIRIRSFHFSVFTGGGGDHCYVLNFTLWSEGSRFIQQGQQQWSQQQQKPNPVLS